MTSGWELPLRKRTIHWWQALDQHVFCTDAISLKKQRKTLGAQLSKSSPCHNTEEDLACAQAVTKKVTKDMLMCCFLGHVNLMSSKREMQKALPSQRSGNLWFSQWQEGRTTARGVFAW